MVADFVSADYEESACVLFKAGKTQDGYFTNDDITAQTRVAMDILSKHYADEEHVFIFDNAKTHLKRANDALSAWKMPKFPSESWGVTVVAKDNSRKLLWDVNGNIVKEKIWMADAHLPNGAPQPLYFPEGHECHGGWFKGMAQILMGHDYANAPQLLAEFKDFKCPSDKTDCCCHHLMYSQPNYVNVRSIMEMACHSHGFEVVFLLKFHCKLNFNEQCWGFAKQHRLNGHQAAWVVKKYCGH
ncbi:hypothetical protein EDD17DRAFT_1778692 [Pisolithus thermaeus]|nr:hypothetical protein EDD17DRAFT_1778692 [Pisolithus thermaeus]